MNEIRGFWEYPSYQKPNPDYLPLAELFELSGNDKFAALFYQLSKGSVPKSVYRGASLFARQSNLFGINIVCQKNIIDDLAEMLNFEIPLGGNLVRVYVALLIFIFGTMFGGMLGWSANYLLTDRDTDSDVNSLGRQPEYRRQSELNTTPDNNLSIDNNQAKNVQINYQDEYDTTDKAINQIAKNLAEEIKELISNKKLPRKINSKKYNNPQDIVRFCTKEVLGIEENFSYTGLRDNEERWKYFSAEIEKYQKDNGADEEHRDGVINLNKQTQGWLEDDIRECLNLESSPSTTTSSPEPPDRR